MVDRSTKLGCAVKRHLKNEYVICLTTVDATLTPQPRPVWFLLENDCTAIRIQTTEVCGWE